MSGAVDVVFRTSGLATGRSDLAGFTRVWVAAALDAVGWSGAGVTVMYCSDKEIRRLNRDFRAMDSATDILSFPALDDPRSITPQPALPLGDLAIALGYTRAHAKQHGRRLADEVGLLLVHGVLHLLGWDHATKRDEARMWREQDRILAHCREAMPDALRDLDRVLRQGVRSRRSTSS